jgi:hypothetical protein
MSALIAEEFISVTPTLIRVFGPSQAIVLQHIHFRSLTPWRGDRGETRMSQTAIAEDTGLSGSSVYRALKALLSDGVLSIRSGGSIRDDNTYDQTRTYVVDLDRIPEAGAISSHREGPISSHRENPISSHREGPSRDVTKWHLYKEEEEIEEENPPTPLQGGNGSGAAPQLFTPGSPNGGATHPNEMRRKVNGSDADLIEAKFDRWWSDYPSGRQRGSRVAALKAWRRALKAGVSIKALEFQLGHYLDARQRYTDVWFQPPVLMHGSTWINGRRDEWAEPWTDDDLQFWPPPPGESWDVPPSAVTTRDEVRAAALAREGALAYG